MINFWLSLWRRRLEERRLRRVLVIRDYPNGFTFSVNGDLPQFVRIVRLPYDHEANGDFR